MVTPSAGQLDCGKLSEPDPAAQSLEMYADIGSGLFGS
jgi:hypothetical protein